MRDLVKKDIAVLSENAKNMTSDELRQKIEEIFWRGYDSGWNEALKEERGL